MTTDSNGNKIRIGDFVAYYGYLNDDGYNVDPNLDCRPYGCMGVKRVENIQGMRVKLDDYGWTSASETIVMKVLTGVEETITALKELIKRVIMYAMAASVTALIVVNGYDIFIATVLLVTAYTIATWLCQEVAES